MNETVRHGERSSAEFCSKDCPELIELLKSVKCKIEVHDLMILWIIYQLKLSKSKDASHFINVKKYKSYITSLPITSEHPFAVEITGELSL